MSKRGRLALLLAMTLVMGLSAGCGETGSIPEPSAEESTVPVTETAEEKAEDYQGIGSALLNLEGAERPTEAATEAPETEEAPRAESAEEEPEPDDRDHSERRDIDPDLDEIRDLDNTAEDYGFNNSDRDSLNRPEGVYYYDSKYKKYGGLTHIDTERKVIYLTMDEGYERGNTPKILDTLKRKGVHAVFFITKQFYDENPDLIQRMIDEGHKVGNHTCAHPAGGMPQLGADAIYKDVKKLNDLIYDKYDYQMTLFRFPEGVASKQSVALLKSMGYTSVFWSFAYHDYDPEDEMDPDVALSRCLQYIHPGAIYLLHAISDTNTEILGDFIDEARDKGYEFGNFPE